MPTTVFLILAAWAASKGWPQMDAWLLNHPKYGPTLRDWRANGTVPRKAKVDCNHYDDRKWYSDAVYFGAVLGQGFTDTTMLVVAIWLWLVLSQN